MLAAIPKGAHLPMRCHFLRFLAFTALVVLTARAQFPQITPEQSQELLKRFPDADTNKDGVLSTEEAIAYMQKVQARRNAGASAVAAPTVADAAYGPHARNILDFWRAPSATAEHPAPLVIYIHGGGFVSGDKSRIRRDPIVQQALDAGVSIAAINYRYLGPDVPLPALLRDCARAVQFLRTQAAAWHIDATRIAAYGESGGAGASLWLAFHPDLADPKNSDPVLRESTRLVCAGAVSTQFSYDMARWDEVFGAELTHRFAGDYSAQLLYGLDDDAALHTDAGKKSRADCDMLGLMTKSAPPFFLTVTLPARDITDVNQLLHSPRHSQLLYERARELGVPVIASIPAYSITPPTDGPRNLREFFLTQLASKPLK